MKRFLTILTSVIALAFVFTSCEETEEFNEFSNWKERNDKFIDSIANVVANYSAEPIAPYDAEEGDMFRILSFKLDPNKEWGKNRYVYCKVIKRGEGTEIPYFTDSIRMNYRARLIPSENYPMGYIADQSFKTPEMNPEINSPVAFWIPNLIDGMASALQQMRVGDIWRMYIPYTIGYGTQKASTIPAYSTLVYDVNLTEIARAGTSLSPR
ncbi:MAG: FKBP-type peptidyl-prolyl cis-trans isomerase [Bacteroidaceae bacterium]|nr:FKBP-type peptidyl-prolyl cis-trans isomerase [Bacteroidaceae bacterium]